MSRYVTFRFDDGFTTGARKVGEILGPDAASFFIIADRVLGLADLGGNPVLENADFGSLAFWRDMAAHGHDIQPHGYSHVRLEALPAERQRDEIARSLDLVRQVHSGPYVFSFPFNVIPDGLDLARLGFAAAGFASVTSDRPIRYNDAESVRDDPFRLRAWAVREQHLDAVARQIRDLPDEAWLVLGLHSLDGEGFEPWTSAAFAELVRCIRDAGIAIVTAAAMVQRICEAGPAPIRS